jgi:exodeoxyribonuclease-3
MKIISWNVNGIRAIQKKGMLEKVFVDYNPDILAIQETKCEELQIPDGNFAPNGYFSFFLHAENRKGYSGVAVYSKEKPIKIEKGLDDKKLLDNEGRTIILHFKKYILMNCYFPNGGKSEDHYEYKLKYYESFLKKAKTFEKEKPVIFLGDINATIADIDLARPKENAGKLGCTEKERKMLAIYGKEFIDTFRFVNKDKIQYTWWDMKTRSREKNVGWRIDYIFVSKTLNKKIKNASIEDNFLGSDHCPVLLDINL